MGEKQYQRLLYKYSHIGCPAVHFEDNCDRPSACAENGRCLDLSSETPFTRQFKKDCEALHKRLEVTRTHRAGHSVEGGEK